MFNYKEVWFREQILHHLHHPDDVTQRGITYVAEADVQEAAAAGNTVSTHAHISHKHTYTRRQQTSLLLSIESIHSGIVLLVYHRSFRLQRGSYNKKNNMSTQFLKVKT